MFDHVSDSLSRPAWEKLKELLSAGQSKQTIYTVSKRKKLYQHCHALPALLEASYLVFVREVED